MVPENPFPGTERFPGAFIHPRIDGSQKFLRNNGEA